MSLCALICSIYSGTVAGAREAFLCGFPAIAMSYDWYARIFFHFILYVTRRMLATPQVGPRAPNHNREVLFHSLNKTLLLRATSFRPVARALHFCKPLISFEII
jgi:hypothetical protein